MNIFINCVKDFIVKAISNYIIGTVFHKIKQPIEFIVSMPIILLIFIAISPLVILDIIRGINRDYKYMFAAYMAKVESQILIFINSHHK